MSTVEKKEKSERAKPSVRLTQSRRNQQKLDKHERIRQAAMTLFASEGYEKTTTKAVAELAGVATGTLFLYARDKQDLLFMVMFERLSQAVTRGFDTIPKSNILNQWLHLFRELYLMYQEHPSIGKAFVKALPGADGPNAQQVNTLTFGFLHRLSLLTKQAQDRGEIAKDIDPFQVSANIFALYFSGLMAWLQGFSTLEQSLDPMLKNALSLQIRGLRP